MANKVDEGGSSTKLPGPTIGPKHPIPQIGPKYPTKTIVVPVKTASQNAGAPKSAYTPPMTSYIPPPYIPPTTAAQPLNMTDYAGFEQQDSAAASQAVTPPTPPATPYTPGVKPTPEEIAKTVADL